MAGRRHAYWFPVQPLATPAARESRTTTSGSWRSACDNQNVTLIEPAIKFTKTISAGLQLDAKVTADKRQDNIAGDAAADRTRQRHAHRRQAACLQRIDDAALGASESGARSCGLPVLVQSRERERSRSIPSPRKNSQRR
jgi:hypothetical protein